MTIVEETFVELKSEITYSNSLTMVVWHYPVVLDGLFLVGFSLVTSLVHCLKGSGLNSFLYFKKRIHFKIISVVSILKWVSGEWWSYIYIYILLVFKSLYMITLSEHIISLQTHRCTGQCIFGQQWLQRNINSSPIAISSIGLYLRRSLVLSLSLSTVIQTRK